jgi:hypothetical protein
MVDAETDCRPKLLQVVEVLSVICDEHRRLGRDGHEGTIDQLEEENLNK